MFLCNREVREVKQRSATPEYAHMICRIAAAMHLDLNILSGVWGMWPMLLKDHNLTMSVSFFLKKQRVCSCFTWLFVMSNLTKQETLCENCTPFRHRWRTYASAGNRCGTPLNFFMCTQAWRLSGQPKRVYLHEHDFIFTPALMPVSLTLFFFPPAKEGAGSVP